MLDGQDPAPIYVAHIAVEAGGFRAVIMHEGETIHRSQLRPDRDTARRDAAMFVILRPEEHRVIQWADEHAVWRGAEQVGWIALEEPLCAVRYNGGTFYPGPGATPFRPLLESTLDYWRRWKTWLDSSDGETPPEEAELLEKYEAACIEIQALGLSIGTPPRNVQSLSLYGEWRLDVVLANPEPTVTPDSIR